MADNNNVWDRYDAMVLEREAMQRKIEELCSIAKSLRDQIGGLEQSLRFEREDSSSLRKSLNAVAAERDSWRHDYEYVLSAKKHEVSERERFESIAQSLVHCILFGGLPSAEAIEEISKHCATAQNPIERIKRIREVTGVGLVEAKSIVTAKQPPRS